MSTIRLKYLNVKHKNKIHFEPIKCENILKALDKKDNIINYKYNKYNHIPKMIKRFCEENNTTFIVTDKCMCIECIKNNELQQIIDDNVKKDFINTKYNINDQGKFVKNIH